MQFIKDRFNYLFNSTKGLILVAIAMIALVTSHLGNAFWADGRDGRARCSHQTFQNGYGASRT